MGEATPEPAPVLSSHMGEGTGQSVWIRSPQLYALYETFMDELAAQAGAASDDDWFDLDADDEGVWFEACEPPTGRAES